MNRYFDVVPFSGLPSGQKTKEKTSAAKRLRMAAAQAGVRWSCETRKPITCQLRILMQGFENDSSRVGVDALIKPTCPLESSLRILGDPETCNGTRRLEHGAPTLKPWEKGRCELRV